MKYPAIVQIRFLINEDDLFKICEKFKNNCKIYKNKKRGYDVYFDDVVIARNFCRRICRIYKTKTKESITHHGKKNKLFVISLKKHENSRESY